MTLSETFLHGVAAAILWAWGFGVLNFAHFAYATTPRYKHMLRMLQAALLFVAGLMEILVILRAGWRP